MRSTAIVGSVLAAGLSLVGIAGLAGVANSEATTNFLGAKSSYPSVPGPQPMDVAHGALQAPDGSYWDVYSRDVSGGHAGAENAHNVIGLYLDLDPSQVSDPNGYSEDVFGHYDCSLVTQEGTPRMGVSCDDGQLPVVAFQQAS